MPAPAYELRMPLDLLQKLGRDLADFRQDAERQWDHAYDFAITAWHLTDWVWHHDAIDNPEAATRFGYTSLRSFQAKICAKHEFINICNELAIGSKHFHVGRRDKVVEEAYVSAGPGFTLGSSTLGVDRLGPHPPVLKVRMSDGTAVKVAEILNQTMEFWVKFFRKHGLLPEGLNFDDLV